MLVNGKIDLSEGQAKANLLSPTAVSHYVRKYAVPNVERRIAQERLWPSEDDTTFEDTLYHSISWVMSDSVKKV